MTLMQIRQIVNESKKIGSVKWIYLEGGEPFLFYPILLEAVALARTMGFQVGIVTNGYWAISEEDAEGWLKPLQERGLDYLSVSDDFFHYGREKANSAKRALQTAQRLGIPASPICIEQPVVEPLSPRGENNSATTIGGGVMFRGRAAEKLTAGLPRRNWQELVRCPHEDLQSPRRVHVDPYGHIHLCQGISMGNMWQVPLSVLVHQYRPEMHPICGPLLEGGPAALARKYAVDHQQDYLDECHFCFLSRRALLERFPQHLAPEQVYGLEQVNEFHNK